MRPHGLRVSFPHSPAIVQITVGSVLNVSVSRWVWRLSCMMEWDILQWDILQWFSLFYAFKSVYVLLMINLHALFAFWCYYISVAVFCKLLELNRLVHCKWFLIPDVVLVSVNDRHLDCSVCCYLCLFLAAMQQYRYCPWHTEYCYICSAAGCEYRSFNSC